MPAAILSVRLVHLIDEKQRRELMIIYIEDASLWSIESWEELLPGGKKADKWPAMQEALIVRAQKKVLVRLH
jgi:hypothetical protein